MAELLDRMKREERVAKALRSLHGKQLKKLKGYLGEPPNPDNVPAKFWKEIEDDTLTALLPLLALIYHDSSKQFADGLIAKDDATKWAESRTEKLGKLLAENNKGRFEDAAKSLSKGEIDEAAFLDRAGSIFGDTHADGIAINETTVAAVRGQEDAKVENNRLADAGEKLPDGSDAVVMVAYWEIEDNDACPVCKPLNGLPESEWSKKFPDGPGPEVHPHCRCRLGYRPGTVAQATPAEAWNESLHPRAADGKFGAGGGGGVSSKSSGVEIKAENPEHARLIDNELASMEKFGPVSSFMEKDTFPIEVKDPAKLGGPEVKGRYDDNGIIGISNTLSSEGEMKLGADVWSVDSSMAGTIRHEYGHRFYYNALDGDTRLAFEMDMSEHAGRFVSSNAISQYSTESGPELFAESFSAYTAPNYEKGMLPPDIEAFMDKHVAGK